MRLLIISDMLHYRNSGGEIYGWGPTVTEINCLSGLFEQITHIGTFSQSSPPPTALPYRGKIRFVPLRESGGPTLWHKLGVLAASIGYLRVMLAELPKAEVVHVRCPANIPLLAILLLSILRKPVPRWVKYAGNWRPTHREAWSYTFQRWWLQHDFHHGAVSVNGRWPDQPRHVYSFLNPSLTREELIANQALADGKKLQLPLYLLFVGRVEEPKGTGRTLRIVHALKEAGIPFELHIAGDGPDCAFFEEQARTLGIAGQTTFHGWLDKENLAKQYSQAHFLLLPSTASEGWPKVLSEGMSFGVVPLSSTISSIPQILGEYGAGAAHPPEDIPAFVNSIKDFLQHPETWLDASRAGQMQAEQFTYESYLNRVRHMFWDAWKICLPGFRADAQ